MESDNNEKKMKKEKRKTREKKKKKEIKKRKEKKTLFREVSPSQNKWK